MSKYYNASLNPCLLGRIYEVTHLVCLKFSGTPCRTIFSIHYACFLGLPVEQYFLSTTHAYCVTNKHLRKIQILNKGRADTMH